MKKTRNSLDSLPDNSYSEVKFEEFEYDPITTLKSLYDQMNLSFPSDQQKVILNYLNQNKGYRKNRYTLSVEEANQISMELSHELNKYGYENPWDSIPETGYV